jgi:hypothetical protein
LAEFIKEEYSQDINPDILLRKPYKFVDIKIIYPVLFEKLLAQYNIQTYDFIGWTDCDLIYGNLNNFIDFNKSYHIIGRWFGHFLAFKNIANFKYLYREVPDYCSIIIDEKIYIADEFNYMAPLTSLITRYNYTVYPIFDYICDIIPECFFDKFRADHKTWSKNFFNNRFTQTNISYVYMDKHNNTLLTKYDDGTEEENTYCHLQKRPLELDLDYEPDNPNYYIVENKFTKILPSAPITPSTNLPAINFSSANLPAIELLSDSVINAIPRKIYMCWHSSDMPDGMKANIENIRKNNPEFEICVYNEEMCLDFISMHFPKEVALAYQALIPKSYKTDLWRVCILYIMGGIYMDISTSLNNFKLINLTDKEYLVNDGQFEDLDKTMYQSIHTGFIVARPSNDLFLKTIYRIVFNVCTNYFGVNQ